MSRRSQIPKTNKCLVLDVDETLVSTRCKKKEIRDMNIMTDPQHLDLRNRMYYLDLDDVTSPRGTGDHMVMWGIRRPHLDEFLQFCFDYFQAVTVWSAGATKYVHLVCEDIFRGIAAPEIIYTRPDCIGERIRGRELLVKPLMKMITSQEGKQLGMTAENTIIIDDRDTAYYRDMNAGIPIPAYSPTCSIGSLRRDDPYLPRLQQWFLTSGFAECEDVRSFIPSRRSQMFLSDQPSNYATNSPPRPYYPSYRQSSPVAADNGSQNVPYQTINSMFQSQQIAGVKQSNLTISNSDVGQFNSSWDDLGYDVQPWSVNDDGAYPWTPSQTLDQGDHRVGNINQEPLTMSVRS